MAELPRIVYKDEDIFVVYKPAGMASQPDRSLHPDMVNWLRSQAQEWAKDLAASGKGRDLTDIYVVHRLDLPVSGVMVYARNPRAAGALSKQLSAGPDRRMGKEYLAVLTGIPAGIGDGADAVDGVVGTDSVRMYHLEAWLTKAKGRNLSIVLDQEASDAGWCALDYEILAVTGRNSAAGAGPEIVPVQQITERFPDKDQILSLVRVHLLTGRRHQIRAMMAHTGAGIWGDTKYNPLFAGRRGQFPLALQAVRLCFHHPSTGKQMEFSVPPGEAILARMPEAEGFYLRAAGQGRDLQRADRSKMAT